MTKDKMQKTISNYMEWLGSQADLWNEGADEYPVNSERRNEHLLRARMLLVAKREFTAMLEDAAK